MSPSEATTRSWPELAAGLYDALTGRNAEITYSFSDLTVDVPSGVGSDDAAARWRVDGTIRVSTRNREE